MKVVLLIRTDLRMTTGKIAAQCGHAVLGLYETQDQKHRVLLKKWRNAGTSTMIALRVDNEKELIQYQQEAISKSLNHYLHIDGGATQVPENTPTVLAIGPALPQNIDSLTRSLKLLK